ncbi:hypothetical protein DI383_01940 [Flavobacteriaceae bacterium LYZ1037]|nr:hypothetical protein DI383_01940 [Flavobacteriaceae bacterium LYZ1037]
MKKIILILSIGLLVFNCSSDSSDDSNDSNNCPKPNGLNVYDLTNTTAQFSWNTNVQSSLYQVQYGQFGFGLGSGTTLTVPEQYTLVEDLLPQTQYAFYVRVFCNNTNDYSNWAGPFNFVTLLDNPYCNNPSDFSEGLYPESITHNSIELNWGNPSSDGSQIEYGLQGFTLGSGTTQVEPDFYDQHATVTGLNAETTYDFYLRNICDSVGYSAWIGPISVTTEEIPFNVNCLDPVNFELNQIYTSGGSDYLVFVWDAQNSENTWQLSKSAVGTPAGSDAIIDTSYNPVQLTNHTSTGVVYDFYVRANCSVDGYSDWVGPITVTGP